MKGNENTRPPGGPAPEGAETRSRGPGHASKRAMGPLGAPMGEVPQYSYAWVKYVLGALLALLLAFAVFKLQYSYGQAPHRVIKIFVGLLLFLFVFFRPWMALHAWLLAMPMGEWLPATGIPGLNAASLLLVTLMFSWIAPRVMRGERLYRHSRLALPMAAYMAVLFMSIGHAALFPLDGVGRSFLDVLRLAWQVILVLPIYYVVVNTVEDKKQIRNLLLTFAAGCVLAGFFAAFEFAHESSTRRIAGTLGDVNDLGAYFAMCAAMLVALMMNSRVYPYLKRAVVWLSAVLTTVAVALPKSRGAYVGITGGLGFLSYLSGRRAFIIFLIVLVSSPLWAPDIIKDRLAETTVESFEAQLFGDMSDQLDPSASVRLKIWGIVVEKVAEQPVFGYGYGSVPRLTYGLLRRPFSSHSLYFETAADSGLVGVAVLAWLFIACARSGYHLRRLATDRLTLGLANGFLAATVALLIVNVFGQRFTHSSIAGTYFFLAGLVERSVQLEKVAREEQQAEEVSAS